MVAIMGTTSDAVLFKDYQGSVSYIGEMFVAAGPNTAYRGSALQPLIRAMQTESHRPLLQKYHLEEIDPDCWYAEQNILNMLRELPSDPFAPAGLVAIGLRAGEQASIPARRNTLERFYEYLPEIAASQARDYPKQYSAYWVRQLRTNCFHIINNSGWPSSFFYGWLWSLTDRLKPANHVFRIRIATNPYGHQLPGVLYDIRWGARSGRPL